MATVTDNLAAYKAYMRRRRRAEGTQAKYASHLAYFERWARGREAGTITADEIENLYLDWWETEFEAAQVERRGEAGRGRRPAVNTLRLQLTALSAFFNWMERYDRIDKNPMRRIERPEYEKRRNDWLSDEEDDALLRAPRSPQQRIGTYLLRFTGMRVGEAIILRNRDIDLRRGEIVVQDSKTPDGKRRIPILPELRPVLVDWMEYQLGRGLHQPQQFFLATRNGLPMDDFQLYKSIKIVAGRAGLRPYEDGRQRAKCNLSPVSPHTLRRTFGSQLLNQGVRLEVVSALLGHANVTITQTAYAELLQATIAREVLQIV